MPVLKRLLLALLLPILPVLLFGIAFSWGLSQTVGNPEKVKDILDKSGAYQDLIPRLLENTQKEQNPDGITLSDPTVQKAAGAAFTPEFVKQSSERIIDSIYAWLEGRTDKPDFNIDLTGARIGFADRAAQEAQERAAALPRCPGGISLAEFDVFTASCLPAGVTPQMVAERVRTGILNGEGLFDTSSLNADSLKTGDGQPMFQEFESLPARYQQAMEAPFYLSLAAVLVAAAIVFLSPGRRKGLKRVGIILAVVGLIMLVISWLFGAEILKRLGFGGNALAGSLPVLLDELAAAAAANYRLFSGLYLALGLGAVAAAVFIRRPDNHATAATPVAAADDDKKTPPETDSQKTKPGAKKEN